MARLAMLLLLVGLPSAAPAQDTLADPVRLVRLRQTIEYRFNQRLREELGLTDEQAAKVQVALGGIAARRRGMEQEERRMRQALAQQLRPGVAANPDSVARLVDALTRQRLAYAQTFQDEMTQLSAILNPVQRGQYLILRDRLMQRVQELLQQRPLDATLPAAGRRRPPRP